MRKVAWADGGSFTWRCMAACGSHVPRKVGGRRAEGGRKRLRRWKDAVEGDGGAWDAVEEHQPPWEVRPVIDTTLFMLCVSMRAVAFHGWAPLGLAQTSCPVWQRCQCYFL